MAPLDWGLGHASRCIPIVNSLLSKGFYVILAAEKSVATLLKEEFPYLEILQLKGYNVQYSKHPSFFFVKMLWQLPKIASTINTEKEWLKKIIEQYKIDIVVSDNRFGMYNKNAYCIFITHQLGIKTGNAITDKIVQKTNYNYISKFDECWVIDEAGKQNLAGELSHPKKLPNTNLKYIGILSRLTKIPAVKTIDLLVLLSGPEPQRTILETILLQQMKGLPQKMVLIRGVINEKADLKYENEHLQIYSYQTTQKINELILASKIVISRGGYTSMMDFATLQTKAIVVPTPGQTEQEYLAKYLSEKKYCFATTQANFNLKEELLIAEKTELLPYPPCNNEALQNAIKSLL